MGSSGHQAPAQKGMCGLGWGGTGVRESGLAWVGTVLGQQGSRGGGGWGEASAPLCARPSDLCSPSSSSHFLRERSWLSFTDETQGSKRWNSLRRDAQPGPAPYLSRPALTLPISRGPEGPPFFPFSWSPARPDLELVARGGSPWGAVGEEGASGAQRWACLGRPSPPPCPTSLGTSSSQ